MTAKLWHHVVLAAALTLFSGVLRGEEIPVPESTVADEAADRWEFSATLLTYVVDDDRDYVSPTFTADRGWLHLEARYNYEALDTGSVFAGYNFELGEAVAVGFTPMVGAVFGQSNGIAPAYRFSLGWNRFEFYSEGEYLIDLEDTSDSFFYAWTELSYSFTDWFRAGLAAQRTRAYESDLDIQPGFLLGFSWKKFDLTAYLFDSGGDDPTFVFSIGAAF
jgi:hypothetical protein